MSELHQENIDCPNGTIEECNECAGAGMVPIPGSYRTCPCCRFDDKMKPCKKCNGKGFK